MSFRCKWDKRGTLFTLALCLAAATASVGQGYMLYGIWKWIIQLIGVALFCLSMYIIYRHVIPRMLYILEGDCLKVYRIFGKSSALCANVPLYRCTALLSPKEYKAQSAGKVSKCFDYTQNLYRKDPRYLIFDECGEKQALRLEGDEAFYNMLMRFMPSKKV